MRTLSLALLALAVGGCGLFEEDDSQLGALSSYEDYLQERSLLVADLEAEIGDVEAGALGACRAVAVGAKACGGPASYAVYSTEASDPDAVEAMAQTIRALDMQANRQFELGSDCAFVTEPTVVLVDGQCRAQ